MMESVLFKLLRYCILAFVLRSSITKIPELKLRKGPFNQLEAPALLICSDRPL